MVTRKLKNVSCEIEGYVETHPCDYCRIAMRRCIVHSMAPTLITHSIYVVVVVVVVVVAGSFFFKERPESRTWQFLFVFL